MKASLSWRILLCLVALPALASAADWPQFLGPARSNVAGEDKSLPDAFPAAGPKQLWHKELGEGHAGPAVVDGTVVMFYRHSGDIVIDALDALTGTVKWSYSNPTDYQDSFGMDNGPRATPTISGGKVFAHGADGMLYALDLADGKLLWKVDTVKQFGSPQGFFGRACAPLVNGESVILTPGGPQDKAVVAFNAKDGSVLWSAADDEASYASPILASPKVLLCWLRNRLTTLDPATGKVLFAEKFRPSMEASVSAATPILTDKGWFISAEYGVGASLWDVGADGQLKKAWSGADAISCHYSTPVYFEGNVFGFDGRQESGQTLKCWTTGGREVKWNSPRVHGGTVLRVANKLLVTTEEGELWIVKAAADKFDQLASAQILRAGHRSYPAYSNGILYARDGRQLVALRLAD